MYSLHFPCVYNACTLCHMQISIINHSLLSSCHTFFASSLLLSFTVNHWGGGGGGGDCEHVYILLHFLPVSLYSCILGPQLPNMQSLPGPPHLTAHRYSEHWPGSFRRLLHTLPFTFHVYTTLLSRLASGCRMQISICDDILKALVARHLSQVHKCQSPVLPV